MNEKFNKIAKVEKFTTMLGIAVRLIVTDPSPVHGKSYLAYQTGQSVDFTVIGNPVFTLSCDLSFPYHVINGAKVKNGTYILFCHLQYM